MSEMVEREREKTAQLYLSTETGAVEVWAMAESVKQVQLPWFNQSINQMTT